MDMSLEDVIATGGSGRKGGRKGKGKGKGKGGAGRTFKIWGGGQKKASGGKGKGRKGDDGAEKPSKSSGDKLDMSLDDVVQADFRGKGKGKLRGKGGDDKGKGRGKAKNREKGSKGKDYWDDYGKGRGKFKGKDYWDDYGKGDDWGKGKGKSKGKGKRWEDPWASKGYSKGGYSKGKPTWNEHDDWRAGDDEDEPRGGRRSRPLDDGWGSGGGSGGRSWADRLAGAGAGWRRVEQDSASPPPRRRAPPAREAPERRNAGAKERGPEPRRREERAPEPRRRAREEAPPAPAKRARREEPAAAPRASESKRVKVTNISRDLDEQDIKEAFEAEAGRILKCALDRGVAMITFAKPADARKAIDTFDRGELNGKMISVTLDG